MYISSGPWVLLQEVSIHRSEDFIAHSVTVRWNNAESLQQLLKIGNRRIAIAHNECRSMKRKKYGHSVKRVVRERALQGPSEVKQMTCRVGGTLQQLKVKRDAFCLSARAQIIIESDREESSLTTTTKGYLSC